MSRILKDKIVVARKDHNDIGAEHILNADIDIFSFADKRKIVELNRRKWKIFKGEKCKYQVGIWEGDFYAEYCSFTSEDIILRNNLYDDL